MLRKTDPDMIKGYLEDSSNLQGGYAEGAYLPENDKEILEAVKECSSKKTPLTISGAGTGTTGGRIPFGGWVLSTEKLNQIIAIDKKAKTALIQPGVSLDQLDNALKKEGLMYAPDPTEKSAYLGGNVATNASGARSLRMGPTRNHIKRLKVILSTGEILSLTRSRPLELPRLKSSAGYYSTPDMEQIDLFIGSEGTLGIVSEIEVNLIDRIENTFDCIVFLDSEEAAIDLTEKLREREDILMIEYFDFNSIELLGKGKKCAIYFEQKIVDDNYLELEGETWVGMNEKQKEELWEFRHSMPEHINEEFKKHHTVKFASDIAVPDSKFREMFAFYNLVLSTYDLQLFYVKFGHIGQSHLHVNLVPRTQADIPLAKELIMKFVKKAVSLGGTVSAEHGIGKIKHDYLRDMYGDSGIAGMIQIKKGFDPGLILNIGNVFPLKQLSGNSAF